MSDSAERIKVLEIVGNAIVGGMETYVSRLIEQLPKARFEIYCLCPFDGPFAQSLREQGYPVYITPITDPPSWMTIQFAVSLIRGLKIQVVHAHLSNAHLLAALCSAVTGVRTLATLHGRSVPLMDLEIYQLGQSHLSVVCQNAYQHALSLGIRAADVDLVPNGVDAQRFAAAHSGWLQRRLGLAEDTILVGFVGRLDYEKAPGHFVSMASLLLGAWPDVHFVLVGDGPLRAETGKLAKDLGVADRVHFTGTLSDMPAVYASLSILVMCSESEGMPLALLEAMAAGVPAVATQVGGIAEILAPGSNGLLVPEGKPELTAKAAANLLKDPQLRNAMGAAARDRVLRKFPFAATVEGIARLLATLGRQVEAPALGQNVRLVARTGGIRPRSGSK